MSANEAYQLPTDSPIKGSSNGAFPNIARVASLLLFAFPLFIVSVRHWASGIYILLCLLAIPSIRQGWRVVGREERVFLSVIVVWLVTTLIANTANGWTHASVRWYQADIRFLFGIPLFLFFRLYPQTVVGLLRGIPVAAVYVGAQSIYDTFLGAGRVDGPYGPIFFGDISALLAALTLASIRLTAYPRHIGVPLHVLGSVMALVAVILSGTRSAWLAAALTLPLALLFVLRGLQRGRRRFLIGFAAAVAAGIAFGVLEAPELTKERLRMAWNEVRSYSETDGQEARDRVASTSVGFRLEQWRTALILFQARPIVGYGVGNVGKEINRQVASGQTSKVLYSEGAQEGRPTHLHSAYFDALTQKGILGLLALLGVLLCPVYLALRLRRQAPNVYYLLVVNAAAFVVFSLTEDPFIRNNFSSVYWTITASLMVLLLREGRTTTATEPLFHAR